MRSFSNRIMSVIQLEELVSYQLRIAYLDEIADGVGERLLTVNDNLLNSASFKAAGWRPDSSHTKRTYSPPIPTAVASDYFQAPKRAGLTLEDGEDYGGMLTGGGADTIGPGTATKRRRRLEQMEEEEDSSDLTDESDEEHEQRAAQQIKFSKMPVRQRAGSSPSQVLLPARPPTSPRAHRRGSQSALGAVRERPRRDTVTSSEISSENEFDLPAAHRHREAGRAAARAVRLQEKISEEPAQPGIKRVGTDLLPEEEEYDSDEVSDLSGDYVASLDSASILDGVENPINASPTEQVVGTPPRNFVRQSTIRKSHVPAKPAVLEALPPPRPMSMIRPASLLQPTSLLSAALKAKEHRPSVPFQKFAHLSGQGTQGSLAVRIYAPFCKTPAKPFEVLIRPRAQDGQGAERAVTVTDLIGLSLYQYHKERKEPQIPPRKYSVNWWTLRMVEEGGEVDDDFPAFDRCRPLAAFTTVNNASARGGGRMRSNSTAYDDFALVPASGEEYEENNVLTPQQDEAEAEPRQDAAASAAAASQQQAKRTAENLDDEAATAAPNAPAPPRKQLVEAARPRQNPIVTTTYRPNTPLADTPQVPVTMPNTARGQQKLLRVHIMSSDVAPGQMVTVDVTTDTYLAEVLDTVCRKRQLDKANHVLKLPLSGAVVMIDRPVSSIGNVSDLELYRRRFATDGPLSMTGSPSSSSPRTVGLPSSQGLAQRRDNRKGQLLGPHPLAQEGLKQDELGTANYKKYVVWRKQPMRLVSMSERILVIDGEYIHIVPASGGKAVHDGSGKTTTVHFSNVIGCKVARKHPTNVKLVVYRAAESKRYDFEARGADEAAEIVAELKKGISPYREV